MNEFQVATDRMRTISRNQTLLKLSDSFPFSCRGCGHLCCGNITTPIHVLPPEYFRIQWHLTRAFSLEARQNSFSSAFIFDEEHVSGLPVLKLNFQDFLWREKTLNACPFLVAVDSENDVLVTQCAIHLARPHTCRVFPIGMVMDGWYGTSKIQTSYSIMSFCSGFELPTENEPTIPGYTPISLTQTVQGWLQNQMNITQYKEILFHFFEVMTYYHAQGWYKPTSESRGRGSLCLRAYDELANIFYEVPELPTDVNEEHSVIMQRLHWLRDEARSIITSAQQQAKLTFF